MEQRQRRVNTGPSLTVAILALSLLAVSLGATRADFSLAILSKTRQVGLNSFTTDTLAPPTGLTASGGSSVTLAWTATSDLYASGYRVLRANVAGGPYSQIAEVTLRTNTSHVDRPLPGTYYYVTRSFHGSWESGNSSEASATVQAP